MCVYFFLLINVYVCVSICVVLSSHFSTIPKEGGIVVWRKLAFLFQVSQLTFLSCGVSPLLSLPLLSVSLLRSLSPFLPFSISHSLSVAVWSFWRPLLDHSISFWRCRRVSLCSLKPDFPQISAFTPHLLCDWRRHAFFFCGFFKNLPKSSVTLNLKSSSSSGASEDEAGPFFLSGFDFSLFSNAFL